ncbi:MAG: FHIPEP family type III secretion protein [Myxococcales bacterium]|nr:FHIPEP family type III secretion protein [Myxococcales bacterium]
MRAISRHWRSIARPGLSDSRELSEIALTIFVVLIVGMMIVPLPTGVLDVLIVTNLSFSVVLLLVATQVPHAMAFGSFPTILLISTLYRLGLNISSTRLILVQADAGRVIESFGTYVVKANYVVGAIVFFILTIVQYVVIAKGSERVAEVGARFTLDAMPGKQMAIDADLRAGALDYEQANAKRQALHRESQFYGAMDGAMKFVKGDAIASILIILINIIGGVATGTLMMDFPVEKSLKIFGLLTIGDGLVSQIPALLISTASALVVTRVASENHKSSLATDMVSQLLGNPKPLITGACLLAVLALLPGLPTFPFLVLAGVLWVSSRSAQRIRAARQSQLPAHAPLNLMPLVALPSFELRVGRELYAQCMTEPHGMALDDGLEIERKRLRAGLAIELPSPQLVLDPELGDHGIAVHVRGEAVHPASQSHADIAQVLALVRQGAEQHGYLWISMNTVGERLQTLRLTQPQLVNHAIPHRVSLASLTAVMRGLAQEGIGLQTLEAVLETFAFADTQRQGEGDLLARARVGLKGYISEPLARDGLIVVHTLDPLIEDAIRGAIIEPGIDPKLALDPELRRDILTAVRRAREHMPHGLTVLTHGDVRRACWVLLNSDSMGVTVISYDEIAPAYKIQSHGNITP